MAAQPLSSLHIKEIHYGFGPDALEAASAELMAIVAKTVAQWSSVQVRLGLTFAELVSARSRAAVSMYASFDTFAVQRQMLGEVSG